MRTPVALLKCIGEAVLGAAGAAVPGALAAAVWERWGGNADEAPLRGEVQALAQATAEETAGAAVAAVEALAEDRPAENVQARGTGGRLPRGPR